MLLGTLDASLLENLIAGKGVKDRPGFLMSFYPLTNFEIQRYYQKEPRLNGVYSRNNIRKIKDGAYAINLDEYKSIEARQIAFYVDGDNAAYFNSFGIEHILKK